MKRFEDIIVWQKAKALNIRAYGVFSNCRDFGFKDQILRASVSIMNNIAEGFERSGDKEFKRFLYISKGSAGEVRSMLILGLELGYVKEEDYRSLHDSSEEISRLLSAFIKRL